MNRIQWHNSWSSLLAFHKTGDYFRRPNISKLLTSNPAKLTYKCVKKKNPKFLTHLLVYSQFHNCVTTYPSKKPRLSIIFSDNYRSLSPAAIPTSYVGLTVVSIWPASRRKAVNNVCQKNKEKGLGWTLPAKAKTRYHPLYTPQGPQRDLMFTDLHIDNGLKKCRFLSSWIEIFHGEDPVT